MIVLHRGEYLVFYNFQAQLHNMDISNLNFAISLHILLISRSLSLFYHFHSFPSITLSKYQANRGNELAKEQGLSDKASFQVSSM